MTKINYIPYALILGLLCLGLAACSKNDDPAEDPITYPLEVKATALEEQGPVRLFTKDGEVTDETVIAGFIEHKPRAITLYFNEGFTPDESNKITFMTDSTAQFGFSAMFYRVKKNGDAGLGFMSDFAINSESEGTMLDQMDAYNIGKYNEPLKPISSQPGIALTGTELRVAQGSYRSFTLPVLAYFLKRVPVNTHWEPVGGAYSTNKLYNEFNTKFITLLGERDTIAVQQSWVRYEE